MVHWISLKLCTYTAKFQFVFFVFSFTRSECVIFSYIHFTFPQTSKCFLSNGIKNMHILASGPELQAVRFGHVIFGESFKKEVRSLIKGLDITQALYQS